jgi:murein DD-endopeptidase MepM/ murein hydrolase activator NlpD
VYVNAILARAALAGESAKTLNATDYRVNENDTYNSIAQRLNTSVGILQALNPHVEQLKEGLSINAEGQLPSLQIKLVGTETFKQSIGYKTVKIPTDDLYVGSTKVKSEGKPGEMTITAQVTRIDGRIVSKKTLKSTVSKDPVSRYLYYGTKAKPRTLPTGKLIWPARGMISSRYGYRGWGEFHPAIDIANRVGTPLYAADGGVVIYARYSGNYGYLTKISHGNGVETWYAHQSKIMVSVGERVYRPKGCEACRGTGYKGRVGLYEVIPITPEIARLIQSRTPLPELRAAAQKQGMALLRDAGLMKAREGVTSLEEVLSITLAED